MASSCFMLSLVAVVMLLHGGHGFMPLFSLNGNSSRTHRDITREAVLRKTAEVCKSIATSEGRPFSLTIDNSLTVEKVQEACSGNSTAVLSTVMYHTSIATMYFSNALVDLVYALSEEHHFDDETFKGGRDVLTSDIFAVKASVKQENFIAGRVALGRACHTLQDFYSHSNWVELGKTSPYSALITPDQTLENLAGPNVATCRNCTNGDCTNNILPDLLQQGLLTSGYFNIFSSEKPAGKCSHGGSFDKTSKRDPTGGISKDTVSSSHGSLHPQAADLAVNATIELLEDIRLAVGDKDFLRLMGLSQSTVLCFVIDTTGSMADDIAEAKRVSFEIIDSKRGTQQEPSAYILVPFNDPAFGPLVMTTDADKFKAEINKLSASGGGDIPEMCLSGLQLAMTAAPPSSEIFVFTDAPAKDADLKSTINALIESTKSVVTFMLTDVLASRRRRSAQGAANRAMSQADAQLYRDLAKASGGQAIEVTKSDLSAATTVIEDSSASAVPQSDGNILVTFNNVPAGEFVLRIKGEDSTTSRAATTSFQRQASTQIKSSSISVTAQVNNTSIEPGASLSIPFTVASMSNGAVNQNASGAFTVKAQNDRSYTSSSPSSVTMSEGKANGTVTITVPSSASSGTDVTLTITAQDASASDINFTVMRFSVVAAVTDVTRPVCEVVSTTGDCSSSVCSSAQWGITANISDGVNGTGIDSVTVNQGSGTLNTSSSTSGGINITVATYSASCCAQSVELRILDKVGNVRLCTGQAKAVTVTAAPLTNTTTNSTAIGLHSVSVRHSLWVSLLLSVVWWY
ncbi:hypothetical protein WMY93_005684 [Mugilogobius chulae]|uniref:von Willebrand factor A domain-containing protein 7-like n=1 Tax=Mugilogobius chulae TaxID=88201 RepID=A0AAW0PTC3_9GOBI